MRGPDFPGSSERQKTYTPEQQRELLKTYIKIPPEYWDKLKMGDKIRYYNSDGEFKLGGYVDGTNIEFVPKGQKQSLSHLKLVSEHSVSSKRVFSWMIRYDRIRDIYMEPDIASILLQQEFARTIAAMQHNLKKVIDVVSKLKP